MKYKPRNFQLQAALLFLLLLLFLLGFYSTGKARENRSLKQRMELLESSIEETRQQNRHKVDSLQLMIEHQEQAHQGLKDSLHQLEGKRTINNKRSHEKKAAIIRIADVDSLYREIARHYH